MFLLTNIFEPTNSSDYILATICAFLSILAISAVIYLNRKPEKSKAPDPKDSKAYRNQKFKPLLSLGLFIIFLICSTTAFFSWFTTKKVTTVTINEDYIETSFGKTTWEDIQNIYVHEDKKIAPFSGQKVGEATKILMIIEVDGKTHALSELNYDINEMGKTINEIKNKKK